MKKKLLYILLSLSIIILVLIIINFVDIISIKKDKEYQNLKNAIKVLKVELNNSDLSIIKGEKFNIDYNKKNIDVIVNDNNMEIKELNEKTSKIEIVIPNDFTFSQLYIISNKGNIKLSDVTSDFFSINSKSGNVSIDKLNITNKTDIFVNSSKINIKDSIIHNIDLYTDDGSLVIDGILEGRSEIYTSKGQLEINVKDKLENYRMEIHDNNNNIKVNNKIINDKTYTKGKKTIIINGNGILNINGE